MSPRMDMRMRVDMGTRRIFSRAGTDGEPRPGPRRSGVLEEGAVSPSPPARGSGEAQIDFCTLFDL